MPDSRDWIGNRNLTLWLASGDRGISSNSIVQHLTGIPALKDWHSDVPHDPDDLNRCLRLLDAVPILRLYLPGMRSASPEWAALVARWDDVERSHLDEVGLGWTKARRAPKTYALMREILDGVRRAKKEAAHG